MMSIKTNTGVSVFPAKKLTKVQTSLTRQSL